MKRMTIAVSRFNMNATYTCYNGLLRYGKKCADAYTYKCYTCRYCKVEMSAEAATRLFNSYGKGITETSQVRDN